MNASIITFCRCSGAIVLTRSIMFSAINRLAPVESIACPSASMPKMIMRMLHSTDAYASLGFTQLVSIKIATPNATAATMGTRLRVASVTMLTVSVMAIGIFARTLLAGKRGRSSRMISSLLVNELIALVEPIIRRVSPSCRCRLARRSR